MKLYFLLITIVLGIFGNSVFSAENITLKVGQSIVLDGTTISCGLSAPQNPAIKCNQLKNMASERVYELGISEGVGNCYILVSGDYFGVIHTKKGQISPTYTEKHNGSETYNPSNITVATGFVQLVCNGKCFRD